MMEDTIKWGIIGCGDVTEVKSGPAFNKVRHSQLVAVMRRNGDKAKDYAARHRVPKWYTNAAALINDPGVNAVYIATPPLYHEAYAVQALQAGKPVYVEKPMTLDAAGAERMTAVANATGGKLSVAHYRRQWPLFLKIKALLDEAVLGKILTINLRLLQPHQSSITVQTKDNWRIDPSISGGGLFHDLAPHQLDLLYYFFGKPLTIKGISGNKGGYYEADDTVNGEIIFKGDILFQGHWCFVASEGERTDECEIIGELGKIVFSFFAHSTILLSTREGEQEITFDKLPHVQQP
ncbi:MAG TPA: Gfo/Idh/MocA family oxidoreductase, partial [Flavisolibacter sp.]|nr:Gfo/Idh/MocA family oxidoreductase [Flavisolibacter sp.]